MFAISAMIQTATSKVSQMLVFIRHCVLMKMMTAIKFYHLTDRLLFSLNPAHFLLYRNLYLYFFWAEDATLVIALPRSNLQYNFHRRFLHFHAHVPIEA